MPKSDGAARPNASELAFTGRVWNRLLARQAQALFWLSSGYPPDQIERFSELRWDDLGGAIQEEVARELSRFLGICAKERGPL